MDNQNYLQAEKLAEQYHLVRIVQEYLTSGELVFVATNPELPNCIGSGETEEEAICDLREARIDYIAYLLRKNLPVPDPIHPIMNSCRVTFFITFPVNELNNRNANRYVPLIDTKAERFTSPIIDTKYQLENADKLVPC
ncbi:MAG: type II toxin-antitoxin system HicB family antitoxin [bacterium]